MGSNYCLVNEKPSYTLLGLIVFVSIAIISAGYFTETNKVSSFGYEVKTYQEKINDLNDDNQRMKIIIAEESSFKKISENGRAQKMNLVGISEQRYIIISSSSLASR